VARGGSNFLHLTVSILYEALLYFRDPSASWSLSPFVRMDMYLKWLLRDQIGEESARGYINREVFRWGREGDGCG
jgi:hypothetical protein